ncbi:F-box protein At2g17036-like isoform X1 [Castanea sativa]|uniref:F-box protein At2g17036-like isoform X1 n=1 Tax=Castanea sativa TaxID=21020 RepID=UPI003F653E3D
MRSVSSLLDIFKICVYFLVAIFITLIRGYVISSSSFRFTLFVSLLILTFLSPAHHAEKDKSLIEFFFTILTSASSFVISESPLIVILILTDPSVISTIQPRLQRFIANRHSFSSPSNNIDRPHLPLDLVQEIVNQITTFKNFIAAKGVSRDWRSAGLSISRRPQPPLPGLMLSEPLLTDMRTLFSLYDSNHHQLQLSEVRGRRCWGSQHGWVVTLGPRYVTQLVHLIKGKQINLPPLDAIRRLAPREEWFCLVHKFILLKDPSNESTFLVIAIFGPMNSLAFTRVRLGAALNRRGEGEWVVVANPENLKFKDVVHFNGQIYALCDNGKLVCFKPVTPFANMVQVIADHPQDLGAHRKIYLVESLGNLYAVFRNGFLIPSERTHETTSFFVYKFNFNASAWEEVTRLEGQAFFVGDGNSFSWRFPTIPSRGDCIYFTDDHWDWRKFPRVAYGGHDVGLFDMEIRDILPLTFGIDKPRFYSRPIFVTRNDKL